MISEHAKNRDEKYNNVPRSNREHLFQSLHGMVVRNVGEISLRITGMMFCLEVETRLVAQLFILELSTDLALSASVNFSLPLSPARLRKITVSFVTRHEDGIRYGSSKLIVCCLDFCIFELFVRPSVSCHHISHGPDRYHQTVTKPEPELMCPLTTKSSNSSELWRDTEYSK